MYSLAELFRNSTHKSSMFASETLKAIESAIFTKTIRGAEVPYIKCIIRNKEIRLTPEEAVRQLYVYELIHIYGYSPENIKLEHAIHFGREVKRADIVIFQRDYPDSEYIIVEVKKPNSKEGREQLKSYCNATGAIMGVWSNGHEVYCYQRKESNIFEAIPRIPKAYEKLPDVLTERWTIEDLKANDKLKDGRKSLKALVQEIEDDVLANAGVNAFDEIFKLIFTKLYDELQSVRKSKRELQFRNYGDTDEDLKTNIQKLFNEAKGKWKGVFEDSAEIALTPSHLALCISTLQDVKLFNSNLDVVDDAFEFLMNKDMKGEKGQFFTPRYVIDMCVRMLNPQEHESIIDTAAGSCGFPVHTIFYVWGQIYDRLGLPRMDMFTAEEKPEECKDYVKDKVFAIDFDEKAVRVARTLNLIAGDGHTNVMHLNTLDYSHWKETTKPLSWMQKYHEGWYKFLTFAESEDSYRNFMFDIVMANPPFAGDIKESRILSRYELSRNAKGNTQSKTGRDILFIERNLQFLKPGGRMAIILPQGRFNNSSDKYIRDFIAERCRILAVIGLHENVFKPHTGTKTSVLLVQKWDDDLCPKCEDYPVFFATMKRPGKDNSGEKIIRRYENGDYMRDPHNHPIVEHDLYSVTVQEGDKTWNTEEGIAEAFIEFAKREGFSFFGDSLFVEDKYMALMSRLECSEVMLSSIKADNEECRIDSEYYSQKYMAVYEKLRGCVMLGDIAEMHDVSSNGSFAHVHGILNDDGEKIIPYIRSSNVGNTFIDTNELMRISEKAHSLLPLSQTRLHDIMMARKGKIGGASIITQDEVNYNCNENVIRLTIREPEKYNPYYVTTFFNSNYGLQQIKRLSTGNVQPWVSIYQLKKLKCIVLNSGFQAMIETRIQEAHNILKESQRHYTTAQQILQSAIHFETSSLSHENVTVKSFSEAFSTGRLDAEYFMPKYDDLFALLHELPTKTLGEIVSITKSIEPGSEYYRNEGIPFIRVSDISPMGITEPAVKIPRDTVPDIGRLYPKKDTILLSKDGSVGIAYKIEDDTEAVTSGALLHLRINDSEVLPDYLTLVLNSDIVRLQAERDTNGAVIQHWRLEEISRVVIPVADRETQNTIAGHVRESFSLRRKSESLINIAVKSVELAIELDENTAINFITKEINVS